MEIEVNQNPQNITVHVLNNIPNIWIVKINLYEWGLWNFFTLFSKAPWLQKKKSWERCVWPRNDFFFVRQGRFSHAVAVNFPLRLRGFSEPSLIRCSVKALSQSQVFTSASQKASWISLGYITAFPFHLPRLGLAPLMRAQISSSRSHMLPACVCPWNVGMPSYHWSLIMRLHRIVCALTIYGLTAFSVALHRRRSHCGTVTVGGISFQSYRPGHVMCFDVWLTSAHVISQRSSGVPSKDWHDV